MAKQITRERLSTVREEVKGQRDRAKKYLETFQSNITTSKTPKGFVQEVEFNLAEIRKFDTLYRTLNAIIGRSLTISQMIDQGQFEIALRALEIDQANRLKGLHGAIEIAHSIEHIQHLSLQLRCWQDFIDSIERETEEV